MLKFLEDKNNDHVLVSTKIFSVEKNYQCFIGSKKRAPM